MASSYLCYVADKSVRRAQVTYFGQPRLPNSTPEIDPLTVEEIEFIQARDSFYMATMTETGR